MGSHLAKCFRHPNNLELMQKVFNNYCSKGNSLDRKQFKSLGKDYYSIITKDKELKNTQIESLPPELKNLILNKTDIYKFIDELFLQLDVNKDKSVSFEEFKEWCLKMNQHQHKFEKPNKSDVESILLQKDETISHLNEQIKKLEEQLKLGNQNQEKLKGRLEEAQLKTTKEKKNFGVLKSKHWATVSKELVLRGSLIREKRKKEADTPKLLIELIKLDDSPKTFLYIKNFLRKCDVSFLLEFVRLGGTEALLVEFIKYEHHLSENMLIYGFLQIYILDILQILFTNEAVIQLTTTECKDLTMQIFLKSEISGSYLLKSIVYRITCNLLLSDPKYGRNMIDQVSVRFQFGITGFWQSVVENCKHDYLHVKESSLLLINSYLSTTQSLDERLFLRQKLEMYHFTTILKEVLKVGSYSNNFALFNKEVDIYLKSKEKDDIDLGGVMEQIGNISLDDPHSVLSRIVFLLDGNQGGIKSLVDFLKFTLLMASSTKVQKSLEQINKILNDALFSDSQQHNNELTIQKIKNFIQNDKIPSPSIPLPMNDNSVPTPVDNGPPPPPPIIETNAPPPPTPPMEDGPPPPPPPMGDGPPPPPPMGDGPPPPPGLSPPGMNPSVDTQLQKKCPLLEKKSNIKLKKVFLTKIPLPKIKDTIWKDIYDSDILELSLQELEALFEQKTNTPSTGNENKMTTPKNISFLDPGNVRNMSIILSQLKRDKKELVNDLKNANWKILGLGFASDFKKYFPSDEEKLSLMSFEGDVNTLSDMDKFYKLVFEIEGIETRLDALILRLSFDEKIAELSVSIGILQKASYELTHSKAFYSILKSILAISNTMNVSNFPPNRLTSNLIYGFLIESLPKLSDIKSSVKPSVSLVHYLVNQINTKNSSTLNWKKEISSVFQCKGLSPSTINEELKDFLGKITNIHSKLLKLPKDEEFYISYNKYLLNSEKEVSLQINALEQAENDFIHAMSLYGEEPTVHITDFVVNIENFSNSFDSVIEEINKKNREEEIKRQRLEKVSNSNLKSNLVNPPSNSNVKINPKIMRKLF
eukprot:TRINITY_DN2605_c0_g1_i1.p1 TRINITY_DN2605_c0_g1~~TRINITY_DN2605_c0_g1_i1.p1  ORF type:complete len:1042 (+),score=314.31 TRINITY_DN2605_c0_g1_i1:30-3155(+)